MPLYKVEVEEQVTKTATIYVEAPTLKQAVEDATELFNADSIHVWVEETEMDFEANGGEVLAMPPGTSYWTGGENGKWESA